MVLIVYHNGKQVTKVAVSDEEEAIPFSAKKNISQNLVHFSIMYPDAIIVWCNETLASLIDTAIIPSLIYHNKIICSFSVHQMNYFSDKIGYIEDNPFGNIAKGSRYPTWQMSTEVGAVHASILKNVNQVIPFKSDFHYYLNSLTKTGIKRGLLCYSEPRLLFKPEAQEVTPKEISMFKLFLFVRQHYKKRWLLLLLLNLFLYEKRLAIIPLLYSFLYFRIRSVENIFAGIEVSSTNRSISSSVSVVIPTIGRVNYLFQVLQDLRDQTQMPNEVIIVEQNPEIVSVSELDFLQTEIWPFNIKHHFIHKTGACHARNIALNEVTSQWVFLADDDIRIPKNFIKNGFQFINTYKCQAFTASCLMSSEKETNKHIMQWQTFGSGCSWVKTDVLNGIRFDTAFEHGFGEDADFGMQLRKNGVDVLYNPFLKLSHLKAPVGGFRAASFSKPSDGLNPKPSPTVMAYKLKHSSVQQLNGYKTLLFLKFYKRQPIKDPIAYINHMNERFKKSIKQAKKLIAQPE